MPDASHTPSPYLVFPREEWAALRANTPLSLSDAELAALRGVNEPVSIADVAEIYLPLSRLLNLYVLAARGLKTVVEGAFLDRPAVPPPCIIAVAGSVAVGKSTFARVLRAVLARWPEHRHVDLVTTDGFLHSNDVLAACGLAERKGFPESYDLPRMLDFLARAKSGEAGLTVPIYSHDSYDILPGRFQHVDRPDILIFEGLNVLQAGTATVASDFFDFSIYLDADDGTIETWFIERFLLLQRSVFQNPASFFRHFKDLSPEAAAATARDVWQRINLPNLRDNIKPSRERARLVIRKDAAHAVQEIWLRRN
jgi:type I pantothenate kinase